MPKHVGVYVYVSHREVNCLDNALIITVTKCRCEEWKGMFCVWRCMEMSLEDGRWTNTDLERACAAFIFLFVPSSHSSAGPTCRCGKVLFVCRPLWFEWILFVYWLRNKQRRNTQPHVLFAGQQQVREIFPSAQRRLNWISLHLSRRKTRKGSRCVLRATRNVV